MSERIKLPLMMFGKKNGVHHQKGRPILKRIQVGSKPSKRGAPKPVYEWYPTDRISTGFYPSENIIFVNVHRGGKGTGQRALSSMAQKKLDEWAGIVGDWARANGWSPKSEKVIVNLYYYLPDKRIRDTHNAKKLLMDSLQGTIVTNDYFILDRTIDFDYDKTNPRIEIEVLDYVG